MELLFFDIECSNGRDICEFGYVITDEKFKLIKREVITINPNNKFNLTGRENRSDIKLQYDPAVYYKSPRFDHYHKKIKDLIERPDQIIIGYALNNDANYLNHACERYGLESINFNFQDSQKMLSEYLNLSKPISLENAQESLNISKPSYIHKSDEDALMTKNLVELMCDKMNCSIYELIDLCEESSGLNKYYIASYDDSKLRHKRYIEARNNKSNLMDKNNSRLFQEFLNGLKPKSEIIKSKLNNKLISIVTDYENNNFKEMLALVQYITDFGASYTTKASECDIFIIENHMTDLSDSSTCVRLNHILNVSSKLKEIEIIKLEDFLNILNINELDLNNKEFPIEEEFIKVEKNKKTKSKTISNPISNEGTSINDLLLGKGINLSVYK